MNELAPLLRKRTDLLDTLTDIYATALDYYFGFNYSVDNPGAPWSNMAMIPLIVLAIICFIRLGKKAKQ